MVSPAACPPPHAAARRLGPRRAVHLVRREYRHLRPRVALSEPGSRLADGRNRKAGKLVSRSEEHTSELQSLMRISYAVFCMKKKQKKPTDQEHNNTSQYHIKINRN